MKKLLLFALALFFIPIASAITYPTLTGYVTDNANMITPEYREKIAQLADQINKNTTVEIAILTIESLEGDSPENYALQTFRNNDVGKKDKGLLILVSKNDRKYRFEVGSGLEETISDSVKVSIGEKILVPNFKQEEYGKGIYESMINIEVLVTTPVPTTGIMSRAQLQTTYEIANGYDSQHKKITLKMRNIGDATASLINTTIDNLSDLDANVISGGDQNGNIIKWEGDLKVGEEHNIVYSIKVVTGKDIDIPVKIEYAKYSRSEKAKMLGISPNMTEITSEDLEKILLVIKILKEVTIPGFEIIISMIAISIIYIIRKEE